MFSMGEEGEKVKSINVKRFQRKLLGVFIEVSLGESS
jgi:hypothetical protein